MLGSVSCVEKSPSPGWNNGIVSPDPHALELPLVSSSSRRLCSSSASASFFCFLGLAHAVEDRVHLPAVASVDVSSVLVVVVVVVVVNVTLVLVLVLIVAVVIVILPADDEVLTLRAPALTPIAALAVVSLFFSQLLGFRSPFRRSSAFSMIAS